jgi:hypothetical protein
LGVLEILEWQVLVAWVICSFIKVKAMVEAMTVNGQDMIETVATT